MELTRNVYTPASLAKELAEFAGEGLIRSQIKIGALKARRLGGRNLIIFKEDVQAWLHELPLASEPKNKPDKKPWPTPQMIGQERARERKQLLAMQASNSLKKAGDK